MRKLVPAAIGSMLAFPSMAFSHTVADGGGFISGLSHPVLGFDHLLAMLSVGILSAQIGGKAIWTIPSTFVAVMLVGGILGIQGIKVFSVEFGIAFSVLVLGIAIAAAKKLPVFWVMIFVGFFAIFHGYAHGTEMPYLAKPAFYVCGFVAGTAGIHIAGVLIGLFAVKFQHGGQVLRYFGAGIAGIGFYLLIL